MTKKQKRIFEIIIGVIALAVALSPKARTFIKDTFFAPDAPYYGEVSGKLSVHYIDVGQGDSTLVISPDGGAMLIDSGTAASSDYLLEYLSSYGISSLDFFVLTHPHTDHIGGASAVFDELDVKEVILPYSEHNSSMYEKVLRKIDKEECTVHFAESGMKLDFGDALINILGPVNDYDELNNQSAVLNIGYGSTAFLFTGDAEEKAETDMLSRHPSSAFKANVLKMGHHGSSTSSSRPFFNAVSPAYAVISCGENNDYGHPHREIISLLEKTDTEYFRTDISGSIIFVSDGKTVSPVTPERSL